MRNRIPVCLALLVAAVLQASPSPAETPPAAPPPTTRPAHDRDPWVFRCVLDGNPRMLVISLGDHWWMAFNTVDCSIYKIWNGEIELTGAVYDTQHGPQPKAKGRFLLDGTSPIQTLVQHITGERQVVITQWNGYLMQGDAVHLKWRKANLNFDLQPKLTPSAIELMYLAKPTVEDEGSIPDMAIAILPMDLKANIDGPRRVGLKPGLPTVIRIKLEAASASSNPTENR